MTVKLKLYTITCSSRHTVRGQRPKWLHIVVAIITATITCRSATTRSRSQVTLSASKDKNPNIATGEKSNRESDDDAPTDRAGYD